MKYHEQRYLVLNSIYKFNIVYVIIYIINSIYRLLYKNSKLINGIYAGDFHLIYFINI